MRTRASRTRRGRSEMSSSDGPSANTSSPRPWPCCPPRWEREMRPWRCCTGRATSTTPSSYSRSTASPPRRGSAKILGLRRSGSGWAYPHRSSVAKPGDHETRSNVLRETSRSLVPPRSQWRPSATSRFQTWSNRWSKRRAGTSGSACRPARCCRSRRPYGHCSLYNRVSRIRDRRRTRTHGGAVAAEVEVAEQAHCPRGRP